MPEQSEEALKAVIERYQQRVFALVLYLLGSNPDSAYEAASTIFADVLRKVGRYKNEKELFTALIKAAVEFCKDAVAAPSEVQADFINLPPARKGPLMITREALFALQFQARALLLLRDQLHFSYADIARITGISERSSRSEITRARVLLRDGLAKLLNGQA